MFKKNSILIMWLIFLPAHIVSFQTLKDFQRYAQAHEELPPSNSNWNNPDYSEFHRRTMPSKFDRFLNAIGLKSRPLFNPWEFKKKLEHITKVREKNELNNYHVLYLRATANTRIFLWSDIHGAYHSLMRDLTFLASKDIIDEQLKIKSPDHYFIFNGDSIDRAPYVLETLELIFVLLERNPEQVIYIRGKHETNNYWHNFNLRRQLVIRMASVDKNNIPLGNLVSRFFDTLPVALYVGTDASSNKVLRISHFGWENSILDEQYLGNLFEQSDKKITHYNITKKEETICPIDVKVLIKTEEWISEHQTETGLGLLDQELGATTWAVLSSPIEVHQKYLHFYYDAFVEIAINQSIETSTITLYQQDIRKMDGFREYATYNLYTGAIYTGQNIIKSDISIGSTMSLISTLASMGKRVKQGMAVRINQENQTGGIHNHPIRLFIFNDNITPSTARRNIINLIENKHIDLILLPIGNPMLAAYLDFVKSNKIAVFFPIAGSSEFRTGNLTSIIHFRPSHAEEIKDLIEYALTQWASRKFAFFYQDDDLGQDPLKIAHDILKKHGITEWTDVPYTRSVANLNEQAQKIKNAQPDTICLLSTGNQTQELLRALGMETVANKKLLGFSFLAEESFREYLQQHGISVLFASPVANPKTSQLEIVKEYRAAMDAANHTYDAFSLEAYITTSLLLHIMENIAEPISREKILERFQSLKNYQFKGLTLTFNPEHRDLGQPVWIETGEDKEWIQTKDKKTNQTSSSHQKCEQCKTT